MTSLFVAQVELFFFGAAEPQARHGQEVKQMQYISQGWLRWRKPSKTFYMKYTALKMAGYHWD